MHLHRRLIALMLTIGTVTAADPVVVVVEPDETAADAVLASAVGKFDCIDQLEPIQLMYFENNAYYKISNPDGFESRTGVVYFLSADGGLHTARFWEVADESVFENFVDFILESRGELAAASGSEFAKTIKTPTTTAGGVRSSWRDAHIFYSEGFLFISESSSVFRLRSNAQLRQVLKRANQKDWFLWAGTSNASGHARTAMLNALASRIGVQMQQRSNEGTDVFKSRQSYFRSYLEAVRAMAFELDELSAWSVLPADNQPFHFGLQLKTRPGSHLQQSVRGLQRLSRTPEVDVPQEIGSASVSLNVPTSYLPLLRTAVGSMLSGKLREVAERSLTQGYIDIQISMGAEEETGSPALIAAVRHDEATRWLQPDPSSHTIESRHMPMLQHVMLQQNQREILIQAGGQAPIDVRKPVNDDASPKARQPLARIRCDLSKCLKWPDEEQNRLFVDELEKCWQRVGVARRFQPSEVPFGNDPCNPKFYAPIVGDTLTDGDWRIEADLDARGGTLIFSATLGREVYEYYSARKLLIEAGVAKILANPF